MSSRLYPLSILSLLALGALQAACSSGNSGPVSTDGGAPAHNDGGAPLPVRPDGGGGTGGGGGFGTGRGGGGVWPGLNPNDPCEACLGNKCCAVTTKCMNNTACVNLLKCLQQCQQGDTACEQQCVQSNQAGLSDAQAFAQCGS